MSFPTNIWLQNSSVIQPRTTPVKFAQCSPCGTKSGLLLPDKIPIYLLLVSFHSDQILIVAFGEFSFGPDIADTLGNRARELVEDVYGHVRPVWRYQANAMVPGRQTVSPFRANPRSVSRAELMTGGGWCMYASANFERLVLGCSEADVCK